MKNKQGKGAMSVFLVAVALVLILLAGTGVYLLAQSGVANSVTNAPNDNSQSGTPGQNPAITFAFTDALTKQSIRVSALNYKDSKTGNFLGTNPSLATGQKVTPIINGSGYVTAVQPEYTVISGNQNLQGNLYQFANATIKIYNDAGTSVVGGYLGATGNDSAFTAQVNNKILMTGNTYKSTGRLFIVYEISNPTNVSSVTLSDSGTPVSSASIPNCYSNVLTGTPYRVAWEVPAIVGGVQKTYNLQIVSANGNTVQGKSVLTVYNEKDGVDSLSNNILTSGICDSNNVAFSMGNTVNTWFYN